MVQSQNYSIWYLESGAGNLINNKAYFEQGGQQLAQILGRYWPRQNQKVDP